VTGAAEPESVREVTVRRVQEPVALALGSNLGDRLASLARAVLALSGHLQQVAVSSVYESRPVGHEDQPDFFNAVLVGRTDRSPDDLLALAHELEERAGRRRSFRNAPRPLDVDILFFGDREVALPELRIPHPRWKERSFVLEPLAEVAPQWMDPGTGRSVLDVWNERRDELPPVRVVASPDALLRRQR
jgi:2-amino-4-hydroxy-6-hydroxymethyldihydropteridine diphosphokinase